MLLQYWLSAPARPALECKLTIRVTNTCQYSRNVSGIYCLPVSRLANRGGGSCSNAIRAVATLDAGIRHFDVFHVFSHRNADQVSHFIGWVLETEARFIRFRIFYINERLLLVEDAETLCLIYDAELIPCDLIPSGGKKNKRTGPSFFFYFSIFNSRGINK